jgi:septum formation inhibitor MinC
MLRGTKTGLEFVFADGAFDEAWAEVSERLEGRPDFYRGTQATAIFVDQRPSGESFAAFLDAVHAHGISLRGLYGDQVIAAFAADFGIEYLGEPPRPPVASFERKRAARAEQAEREMELTEAARSLDPDFAGARADIARRRARGEPSVPRPDFEPPVPAGPVPVTTIAAPVALVAGPATLYHRGTVRGGQSLQQLGNIVVAGDVNPGAELVASGDILVFGALRGTAHAGAQGDAGARVTALELAATQLRIATFIAADDGKRKRHGPEIAFVQGERIAIAPYAKSGLNK